MTALHEHPDDLQPPTASHVGATAQLFLGNILYALERCAMALDAESLPDDAAFYRGIARKLADAHAVDRER